MLFSALLLPVLSHGSGQVGGEAVSNSHYIFHTPTISQSEIVFVYDNDLWKVPREGGDAVRLTAGTAKASSPKFSPDGSTVAFTADYEGSPNIYVMPIEGGVPKRLTYGPNPDRVLGWTADGKSVLFSSSRLSGNDYLRLFTVPAIGGQIQPLPFPSGAEGSYSPDGARLAYVPKFQWEPYWRRYRGGQTTPIWLGALSDSKVKEIPRKNWNDKNPMWIGNTIYYLSDRDGSFGLYSYDAGSEKERVVVPSDPKWDMLSASGTTDAIVFTRLGSLDIYNLKTNSVKEVPVRISADIPDVRPTFKSMARYVTSAALSPSGARVVVEARGRIFTVPASKGDPRVITPEQGVAHRAPVWSPDGKSIAYLSDASGEYKIVIHDLDTGTDKTITPEAAPAFYYALAWSPDGSHLAYTNMKGDFLVTDVKSGTTKVFETNPYGRNSSLTFSWSPDSKWITYSRDLDNYLDAIFVYNLETGKRTQITDGLSHALSPVFDLNGKYLYFYASTNTGPSLGGNLSALTNINTVSSVYAIVLRKKSPDPLQPESDEEKPKAPEKGGAPEPFGIDLDGIDQRMVALPLAARNYHKLVAGDGILFAGATDASAFANPDPNPALTVYKFSLADRKETTFGGGITNMAINYKGDKVLLSEGPRLSIASTAAPAPSPEGSVNLSGLSAHVDPKVEWKQMFHEGFRIQRDYFYDEKHHGIDLVALERQFDPFLANLSCREDLNYLFQLSFGEMCVGHLWESGGDLRPSHNVPGGLLGADYEITNGHYRLAKVYSGENWNPELRAPLTQPGVAAKEGEYVLAVDGRPLTDHDQIDQMLEGTAGKQVTIKLGPNPNDTGSREVTVIPLGNDSALRMRAWEEDNRRTVDKLSGGKLGYFHVPDTEFEGFASFNRFYFAQIDKAGMVVDERFNHGGFVDDYMAQQMKQPLMSMFTSRYGKDQPVPASANFGPKVLMINEMGGSGGDYFPWNFRKAGVGPIIGKRTWGGLVGFSEFPPLIDGGSVVSPNAGFYNPDGRWEIENHGVPPDIDVELEPALWRQGHDAQLERAVAECLKLLAKNPGPIIKKPARPDKSTLAKAEAPN
jgi:tricorn protease